MAKNDTKPAAPVVEEADDKTLREFLTEHLSELKAHEQAAASAVHLHVEEFVHRMKNALEQDIPASIKGEIQAILKWL